MKRSRNNPRLLFEQGDLKRAERRCKAVLEQTPQHTSALHLLGCIKLRRGKFDDAARLIERAIALHPLEPQYHESLAEVYYQSGRHQLAEAECRLALRADEKRVKPMHLLGKIALEQREYRRAVEYLSAAATQDTPNADAMIDLTVALNRIGKPEMAIKYAGLVLRLVPDHPLALINLGMAYKSVHQLEEAKDAFKRAGDSPMARFNLGYVRMLEDDLAGGLPLMEARKELLGIGKGLKKPEWSGRPIRGRTLLIVSEQGFGDTIMMSRFYPRLFERFERVVVQVHEPLVRLVAAVDPRLEVVSSLEGVGATHASHLWSPHHGDANGPHRRPGRMGVVDYDAWCATMSVPLCLGIDTVDKIPIAPWIDVPPAPAIPKGERLRIGINWAGNPSYAYDAIRSATLEDLRLFFDVPDVEWVSLHKGHREHEAEQFGLPQPLRDARDFYDTARVIAALDLVISTETAIPNLSAAMGVRTCVLTGATTDWRWKSWYANVTVCPQQSVGNWFGSIASALEVIQEELTARTSAVH